MSIAQKCKIEGCERIGKIDKNGTRYFIKGYCNTHYSRERRYGNAEIATTHDKRPAVIQGSIAKIPIGLNAKDGYAIVDKEDAWIDKYFWHINGQGYAATRTPKGLIRMHHIVAGKPIKPLVVDHINRNKFDNRKENLRHVSISVNVLNSVRKKGKYYRGVSKRSGNLFNYSLPYSSRIHKDGKIFHLGYFKTEKDAAIAYNKAARKLHMGNATENIIV